MSYHVRMSYCESILLLSGDYSLDGGSIIVSTQVMLLEDIERISCAQNIYSCALDCRMEEQEWQKDQE